MSTNQINGDRLSGYNLPGFQGGFFTYLPVSENGSVQLEVSFIQKGSRELPSDSSIFYKARLNYIAIPLLYRYRYGDLGFEIGPVLDVLVNSEESDQSGVFESDPPFNTYNLAAIFAINYHFSEKWWVSFRTNNSLTAIRTPEVNRPAAISYPEFGQRNISLTFGIYYSFFGAD